MASVSALPLAALQAGWVGPTAALSLVVIALAFVTLAVILAVAGRGAARATTALSQEVGELRAEVQATLKSLRQAAEEGRGLAVQVRDEVHAVLATSRRIRRGVHRGFQRARRRLQDLDALAEVVQAELEETALDVAATLRGVRRGAGVVQRLRRWMGRRR
jgi:methyl-accepting chemotaxis protein